MQQLNDNQELQLKTMLPDDVYLFYQYMKVRESQSADKKTEGGDPVSV